MAVNLAKAGFEVVGYNRTPGKADPLVAAGGQAAASIQDAVSRADVVATVLPASQDVRRVLTDTKGVFECAPKQALIIDFSTIDPRVSVELAQDGGSRGLRVLDSPVSGGQRGAVEGSLSIMVGGSLSDFDAAQPVWDAVGRTVAHVGPSGSGQLVKAANQLMVGGIIELVAEALVFLEACDVDMEAALRVLRSGLAASTVLERKAETMLARDFRPSFRMALHDKDMTILLSAARDRGVVLPLGGLAAQLIASSGLQGFGDLDHSALLTLVAGLSGRS